MFTFDKKEYDEKKLNEEGQDAWNNLKYIAGQEQRLAMDIKYVSIAKEKYVSILKSNLPEESKK